MCDYNSITNTRPPGIAYPQVMHALNFRETEEVLKHLNTAMFVLA